MRALSPHWLSADSFDHTDNLIFRVGKGTHILQLRGGKDTCLKNTLVKVKVLFQLLYSSKAKKKSTGCCLHCKWVSLPPHLKMKICIVRIW